jgi:CTP synthase
MEIPNEIRAKLALFCNVRPEDVIPNLTAENLYAVPLMLEEQWLARSVCKKLQLSNIEPKNEKWEKLIENIRNLEGEVNIALVGKYMQLQDSYLSVAESLHHGGFANGVKVNVGFIDSENITDENVKEILGKYDGILVPGGFGNRGIEGKISAIKYARENNIPFLGICLGMQMAVVEFARDVLGIKDANSEEFDSKTPNQVIHIMDNQKGITKKGGTMRLGSYPCHIKKGTLAYKIYGEENINERHRHRFEYNNSYKERLESAGMIASGTSPDGNLVEIVEIQSHKFFIAGQFHPEFKSRPDRSAALFTAFIKASKEENYENAR